MNPILSPMSRSIPQAILSCSILFAVSLAGVPAAFSQAPTEVEVRPARRGDVYRFVTLPGTVRANQEVTLHAKIPGYLKRIVIDTGDRVAAGQLLAELELPEIEAERIRRDAELKIAKIEAERIGRARIKAPDLVTPQMEDAAAARLAMARAGVAESDAMTGYGRILAPFDGVVTMRHVDTGAFLPAATASAGSRSAAIVTLMDDSTVRVRVAVPEAEASRVQVGQPVVVSLESFPGKLLHGKVSRQSGALDENTRSLLVEADFPNKDRQFRPGMYALVKIGVEKHENVTLVPAASLVREKTAGFLFLLDEGKAMRVPVKFGFNDGENVEIVEGLPEGARVILPGSAALVAGQAVKAVESR